MTAILGKPLSRRTALRGLGGTLALPWLEAMAPRSAFAMGPGPLPVRLAFMYVPNGVHMQEWTPTTEGANFELPTILRPLRPFRDQLLVLTGLAAGQGRPFGDGGNHAPALAAYLTGTHARKSETDVRNGISADQLAAAQIGHLTRLPSLEIGCSSVGWSCDSGFNCVYTSTMSWRSPTQALPKETSPAAIFNRLFGSTTSDDARRQARRRSVLDTVRDDAASLRSNIGASDRRKLEEYLASVREIEQRIARLDSFPIPPAPAGAVRPAERVPADYGEYLRLLGDLMTLAFQTDSTRICTYLFDHEQSSRSFREIGINGGHHGLSHHGNHAETVRKIVGINLFQIEQLAYILGRLNAIREGDGTLLDRCMIGYGSALGDGNRHDHHDLPILVAGSGGGALRTGRHIRFPTETPLTNLWLTMLDAAGARAARLGDSTGRLRGVTA